MTCGASSTPQRDPGVGYKNEHGKMFNMMVVDDDGDCDTGCDVDV